MKFGVTLRNFGGYPDGDGVHSCLDVAARAEALGYDSVWLPDHIVIPEQVATPYPYNDTGRLGLTWQSEIYDPLVVLSALAQTTERVEIGTSVLVIPYREPLMTAKMLATADQLSNGRIILGAGVGWLAEEFAALGVPAAQFAHRGSVTDDYLRAMKEVWLNTGPARYTGEYVRFSDIGAFPQPVRKPHIPIWMGGKGRRALLRSVRLGNGYLSVNASPDLFRDEVAELRRLAEQDRRDPAELTAALLTGITLTAAPAPTDRALLSGTPAQIGEDLRRYEAAGLQHLVATVRMQDDPSLKGTLAALATVAAEILPQFRSGVQR